MLGIWVLDIGRGALKLIARLRRLMSKILKHSTTSFGASAGCTKLMAGSANRSAKRVCARATGQGVSHF